MREREREVVTGERVVQKAEAEKKGVAASPRDPPEWNMNYLDVDSLRRVHTPPPTSPRPVIVPVSSPSISLFFSSFWMEMTGAGGGGGEDKG